MKSLRLSVVFCIIILCESARATVTIALEFGQFTTSESVTLPGGSLWAIIAGSSTGDLPGGLLLDGALSVNTDQQAILADFAGATIAPQELVGGALVVATGSSSSASPGFILSSIQIDFADFAGLGLNAGDQFGIYWFPGHTTTSNTLPTGSNFEIGGFHQTLVSAASGGETGMQIPADGKTVTISYFDSTTTGGGTSYDPVRFQAVAVPEPSTLLLVSGVALLALRRRR